MKKVYIAPAIYVENVKLSAFCDSACDITEAEREEIVNDILGFNADTCYCYNATLDVALSIGSRQTENS